MRCSAPADSDRRSTADRESTAVRVRAARPGCSVRSSPVIRMADRERSGRNSTLRRPTTRCRPTESALRGRRLSPRRIAARRRRTGSGSRRRARARSRTAAPMIVSIPTVRKIPSPASSSPSPGTMVRCAVAIAMTGHDGVAVARRPIDADRELIGTRGHKPELGRMQRRIARNGRGGFGRRGALHADVHWPARMVTT